eukprot:10998065-Heterocapsa_arctica.AAC.1
MHTNWRPTDASHEFAKIKATAGGRGGLCRQGSAGWAMLPPVPLDGQAPYQAQQREFQNRAESI